MANISQDTFDPTRNILKLLFQNGRIPQDFELNELQDIQAFFRTKLAELSGTVGPIGDGFQVLPSGNPNTVIVKAGFFVTRDRRIAYLPEDYTVTGLTTPTKTRIDFIYFNIPEVEKTVVDFPDINHPTTGQPGALRLVWDVRISFNQKVRPPFAPDAIEMVDLACLHRTPGNPTVITSEIDDRRLTHSSTYHIARSDGLGNGRVTHVSGLTVAVEGAKGAVWGETFDVGSSMFVLPDNDIVNIYIDAPPQPRIRIMDPDRPYAATALEATITTAGGTVTEIIDQRRFFPTGVVGNKLNSVIESGGLLLGFGADNLSGNGDTFTIAIPADAQRMRWEVKLEVAGGGTSSMGKGVIDLLGDTITGMHNSSNFTPAQFTGAAVVSQEVARATLVDDVTITAYSGAGGSITFTLTGVGAVFAYIEVDFS